MKLRQIREAQKRKNKNNISQMRERLCRLTYLYADGPDVGEQVLDLNEFDVAVLAAIAYRQPITRDGLKDIFEKEISRDLIGRLHARELIGTGPRSPRRGAPYTFVTTDKFLIAFDLQSLRDLPDREQLVDAGVLAGD